MFFDPRRGINKKDPSVKHVWREIHDVLINIWDPIGVSDIEAAQDEYDSYIGKIYALLNDSACESTLERHLWFIEDVNMGLSCSKERRKAAVQALLKIKLSN